MLVGLAFGQIAGIAATLLVKATIRPDIVVALVVAVPSAIGMMLILFSGRRWVTALGAFILAIAPGWLGVLVTILVVYGALFDRTRNAACRPDASVCADLLWCFFSFSQSTQAT